MKTSIDLKNMTTSELRELQDAIIEELKSRVNTCTAAVIYIIHVGTPDWVAKLFITHVPKDVTANEIKELLDTAGYSFGEFGQRWANHYVTIGLRNEKSSVINAYRKGDVETMTYDELIKEASLADEVN